ncbi:MAG: DUF4337 domain-containing protein [Acidobacteriota bacterium]|nr:DUF4337 domain-containing protein [Acidobacteriota bacterium]
MAELEIHHERGEEHDPFGTRIGILASVLAVMLAVVTISSHRAHTKGVLVKADVNDKWSYYQAKRIKLHNIELGQQLISLIAPKNEASASALEELKKEKVRYTKEGAEVQGEAKALEHEVEEVEAKALRFDFGEGLIEIGLVLSSLYFISKKKYFPAMGLLAGVAGVVIAASGWWIRA